MQSRRTCGVATIELLQAYGVDTLFGIPGVHTLEFCRGLSASSIQHVQARNEQGAGFMAEGFARATGRPGVALVISGPGVTNAATALGQAYAESLPMLLLSAEPASHSLGKGWGVLHEITEQKAVTAPLTAFSATAMCALDIPELFARAFSIFTGERPRPVHLSIPIDVLEELVDETWTPVSPVDRPVPHQIQIDKAVSQLQKANRPVIIVGGGAKEAAEPLTDLADKLMAPVVSSIAGKGIVSDRHSLSLTGGTARGEVQRYISESDCVLAIGTELSETDCFTGPFDIRGDLIRIDIDAAKMNDLYPASIALVGDARLTVQNLLDGLAQFESTADRTTVEQQLATLRKDIFSSLQPFEQQHVRLLNALREVTDDNTVFAGDACQVVYTGAFAMPVYRPAQWFYPAGFCALGCAVPNAIGAMLAQPDVPVVAIAGDGGFMFTVQELMVAVELKLSLPIVLWNNNAYKQIRDDMEKLDIEHIGVEGLNPDFLALAIACGCAAVEPTSVEEFKQSIRGALDQDRPTLILIQENADWLKV